MGRRGKRAKRKAAQATLEYLVLLSILVIGFIVTALIPNNYFQGVTTNTLQERAMTMDAFTATLDSSDPDIPAIQN